jgi:hypothetical protein
MALEVQLEKSFTTLRAIFKKYKNYTDGLETEQDERDYQRMLAEQQYLEIKHEQKRIGKSVKIQINTELFDYLVQIRHFGKNDDMRKIYNIAKKKLLKYKKNNENFPVDKYLKLLGFYCSYDTRSGEICNNRPVNDICMYHRTFDRKLKLTVIQNLPLLKDIQNIIIEYIGVIE